MYTCSKVQNIYTIEMSCLNESTGEVTLTVKNKYKGGRGKQCIHTRNSGSQLEWKHYTCIKQ